ncbi:MAG: chorismate synthase [Clostridium sp.]|nr:chorismate synthase [Clostridium sp.]
MLRFLDGGESHGEGLYAIIEGLPSNFEVSIEKINKELSRRQVGYGRGGRMAIEKDEVQILSGVSQGKTTGAPITLCIKNKDYENWKDLSKEDTFVSVPRPGHGDLTGELKYHTGDLRNSIERSSARETAIRTAVGALCRGILRELNIDIRSKVYALHDTVDGQADLFDEEVYYKIERSHMRVIHVEKQMMDLIDKTKALGDTLGGWVYVSIRGAMKGLGSFMHYDRRLEGLLAQAIMSIQGVKQVSIGEPGESRMGSEYHDAIYLEEGMVSRRTNKVGGIEGGISNGEDILVFAYMKPIPSLIKKIPSVDLKTMKETESRYERSDVTGIVPLSIVMENVLAFELLRIILDTFSRDEREELQQAIEKKRCSEENLKL